MSPGTIRGGNTPTRAKRHKLHARRGEYENRSYADLRDEFIERGGTFRVGMTKDDLVEALIEVGG